MIYDIFPTRFGDMMACTSQDAIRGLYFVGQKYEAKIQDHWLRQPTHPLLVELRSQYKAYEKQGIKTFNLPLAPQGTDFQQRVWKALLGISAGQTSSYGEIAQIAASKAAVRAVGSAIGHNPISVIIPCHRVIGSTGELTGYAGGVARKAALLAHEGVVLTKRVAKHSKNDPSKSDSFSQDLFA